MTSVFEGVRGVGRPRGGATDTTMLIWKTIEANPGITGSEVWSKVEHAIPAGYALRRYGSVIPDHGPNGIRCARELVVKKALAQMVYDRRLVGEDVAGRDRTGERRYSVGRRPGYYGNHAVIDHTGSVAADHLALADALRILAKLDSKADASSHRDQRWYPKITKKEHAALKIAIKALRARTGGDEEN